MATRMQLNEERWLAIQRCLAGEGPTSIAASLGWFARYLAADEAWAAEASRRPHTRPLALPADVVAAARLMRLELYNHGLLCGAQNIRWELEELSVAPLPSLRTINRILACEGLTHRRTGRYIPKGTPYPALAAPTVNAVHEVDYVGPCYLGGPVRFWSLNAVDLATARCALEPVQSRAGQATGDALWATWQRLGVPEHVQADNEMVFYGSPAHPRGMGPLIRLCLG